MLFAQLGLNFFHRFSNILEWGGMSRALDPFEDYLELLVPMVWFMLIYHYLKELKTDRLKKSERRLKESQEIARIGQWELDLGSDRLYWSDGIYSLFEIDPAEFEASYEAFLEAVHPDDRHFVDTAFAVGLDNFRIERRPTQQSI